MLDEGHRAFVEISPHPVLTVGVQETVDDVLGDPAGVVLVGSLRREEGGLERFLTSVGEVWVRGVEVDWAGVFAGSGAERVGLPTYAFQRERYWVEARTGVGDLSAAGQSSANHPLLGASIALAAGDEWLFTGRLSLGTHPWLADHAVFGAVLLPGAAIVELALHAGAQVGCEGLEELTLEAPLVFDGEAARQLQLAVAEPDDSGRRQFTVHSRLQHVGDGYNTEAGGAEWTRHASGFLTASRAGVDPDLFSELAQWPPSGAESLELESLYDRLAEVGVEYGPAFQGLRAAWRRGGEVFAEVDLGQEQESEAGRFGIHPALLDGVLQTISLLELGEEATMQMPFAWSDVYLHGAGASSLRVRLLAGEGGLAIEAADHDGLPVAEVGRVVTRPVDRAQLQGAAGRYHDALFELEWLAASPFSPAGVAGASGTDGANPHARPPGWQVVLLGGEDGETVTVLRAGGAEVQTHPDLVALAKALDAGGEAPAVVLFDAPGPGEDVSSSVTETARATACQTLELLQGWLADERLAQARLVILTRGAVAAGSATLNLAHSPVWGLVRSAQSEHPDRFMLIDVDGEDASLRALAGLLAVEDEPQVALRAGSPLVPRLGRIEVLAREGAPSDAAPGVEVDAEAIADAGAVPRPLDANGTVLITGASGALGGLIARHLVQHHGVRHLLLASRRGRAAPGLEDLQGELAGLGAQVRIAACDVCERDGVERLLAEVPDEHPLTGVIHAAGVLDDGTIESLTSERLAAVMAPKVDAAWHLHELTEHMELAAFVLFSSAAGVFGNPGQGNYAAANTFLDVLASHRRARGLAATSLAWGPWRLHSNMMGERTDAELEQLAQLIRTRLGMLPLAVEHGLELFDSCSVLQAPLLLPVELDLAVFRSQAKIGMLPAVARSLIRTPTRRARGQAGSLARRLAGVPEHERDVAILELVRGQVATVLGHASAEAVDPKRAFQDLGFDSLSAIDLRNRLSQATGLRLPATLVFDYPTVTAVAEYVGAQVAGAEQTSRMAVRHGRGLDEPIAIVGMSCRFPGGASSPEGLWQLLMEGRDAIGDFPTDRGWDLEALFDPDPDQPGKSYAREGGFLRDAGEFDAAFFGISPREAIAMDPQQRLLLETTWEAFENAGIDPDSLAGSETGVFAGVCSSGYSSFGSLDELPEGLEGYLGIGAAGSVVSGRVSYTFGFQGPAVTVDTGCSSALVALHLAAQALRGEECSLAVAGGVAVIASPGLFTEFSRQRGLAPDGRCKSFAASADGTGFSEGVGVLLLERLSDARRLGHPALALIKGSAINQDGASNGLTAPNGPSQERVIRQALANAGLSPADVDVVEAHGTGTVLGDPIEAQALLATYGQERPWDRPLWLGSIKSNIGHTQAASGAGGVIKMVLAMRQRLLPRTLHLDAPTPHVDWSQGALELLSEPTPWPGGERVRRAGVSSFGISGTNAHVILEEAPEEFAGVAQDGSSGECDVTGAGRDDSDEGRQGAGEDGASEKRRGLRELDVVPWLLSAKSEDALVAQARRLAGHLASHEELQPVDVGWSLVRTRVSFEHRAVVLGRDAQDLAGGIGVLADGKQAGNVMRGVAGGGKKVAFLFPGQGAQWRGMALELLETSLVFAECMEACEAALQPFVDWSLVNVLRGEEGAPEFERVDVVQPTSFAVMVSLAALWRSFGVTPSAVVGHSQGEIAAAYVAGALSLEDAAKVVALRSRALGEITGEGGMISVALPAQEVSMRIARWDGQVSVAAFNGPRSTVVSGKKDALEEVLEACDEDGVRARRIVVDYASHSVQVDAIRERLLADLASIGPSSGEVAFFSGATGGLMDGVKLDGQYWFRSLREPVQFERVTRDLLDKGFTAFVEVSSHPVLTMAVEETLEESGVERESVAILGSLRRGEGDLGRFVRSLAEAHVRGVAVDWDVLFEGIGARQVQLPTYPFQRERYWLEVRRGAGDLPGVGLSASDHPLLGASLALAGEDRWVFTGTLSLKTHPWLAEHVVLDTVQLPGAASVELALRVGVDVGYGVLEELTLQAPLVLDGDAARELQVAVGRPDDAGRRELAIHSRPQNGEPYKGDAGEGEWTPHASGFLLPGEPSLGEGVDFEEFTQWPPSGADPLEVESLYERGAELGLVYGPAFQGLRAAWRRDAELFAEIDLGREQAAEALRFGVHPALLEASLHPLLLEFADGEVELPYVWRDVRLLGAGASSLRVRLLAQEDGRVSIAAADEDGVPVVTVGAVEIRPVDRTQLQRAVRRHHDALFRVEWVAASPALLAGVAGGSGRGAVGGVAGAGAYAESSTHRVVLLGREESEAARALRGSGVQVRAHPAIAGVADALDAGGEVPTAVVFDAAHTGGLASQGITQAAHALARQTLELLQSWLADERLLQARLVVLTHGVVTVTGGGPGVSGGDMGLAQSPVWGLVRSAQSEYPDRFVLIDVDGDGASWETLAGLLTVEDEPQVALREGSVLVPRLGRVEVLEDESRADTEGAEGGALPGSLGADGDGPGSLALTASLAPGGTVLVTGATGTLGGLIARHLVRRHGVRHLLLASRRGREAPGAQELEAELLGLGARARMVACDVSDRGEVQRLLEEVSSEHPLTGVIHAAGTLDDGLIEALTVERLEGVMAPKVDAAWHLHELTEQMDLAAFVLFSAGAATFGNPGQGNYAAANTFLDALACHRRARGLAACSLAWGLWEDTSGMTRTLSEAERMRLSQLGTPLSSEQGLQLFDVAGGLDEPLLVPANINLSTMRTLAKIGMLPPMLRSLVPMPARRARGRASSLARRLAGVPEQERAEVLLDLVCRHVAGVLGHATPEAIDPRRAFKDLGLDSLGAVELRNRLAQETGLHLPATLVFDHPTVTAVADYIDAQIVGSGQLGRSAVRHRQRLDEPIAIVGMSCRYPGGVHSPEELWGLVVDERDVIGGFPSDRGWDLEAVYDPDLGRPGTSYVREGGFVYDAGEFDAAFFGISPREALAMDPQQRLLLEAAWEVFEDAGIDPVSLAGSETGVFAGVSSADYGIGVEANGEGEGYRLTGLLTSVVSGRLAYTFGFEGPAVTVDTACSSSLVALHLAAQSLRSGECSLALAGGVTVISTPGGFIEFSRQHGLAPDGRCKSFAAGADGTGFSDGAGLLLVERLSDARRLGHPVLAVVRGSATNQDGASNGLTAPNGPSQQRVIIQALANAGLSSADVDVVEAHGTGTVLGDPIEAQALLATYGQNRSEDRPLLLGSIKSNIGHSSAAAGVAGVIKMVMAMRHGVLPKTLHVDTPTPHVDWTQGAVQLLTESAPWPKGERVRRAGVSAFGVSGTNAHVVIEEAPATRPPMAGAVIDDVLPVADFAAAGVVPWVVSGKSESALRGQAGRLLEFVGGTDELGAGDVGFSLACRSVFERRGVVLSGAREELLAGLGTLAEGGVAPGVFEGVAPSGGGGGGDVVFVFPGQGAQWVGMAVELLDSSPIFAAQLRACADALEVHVDWSLEEVLRGSEDVRGLKRVDVVQPVLFAVMVALAGLWRECGVHPSMVVGHSQGEIAAVHVAGGLSLGDAARLVVVRSRALVGLMGRGGMVTVALPEEEVEGWLEAWDGRLSVAAVNGPSSVVVSGEREALDGLLGELVAGGVRAREIPVGYASHSAQIEAIREELLEGCAGITPRKGEVPFYSTVTGGVLDTTELDGEYWYRNLREPVRFGDATRSLLEQGSRVFIEVSPHPVLSMGVQETVEDAQGDDSMRDLGGVVVAGSLRRGEGGLKRFLGSLAEVWVRGVKVDWERLFVGSGAQPVQLPTYAFQRERFWIEGGVGAGGLSAAGQSSADHPLLGASIGLAGGQWLFTGRLSLGSAPWLAEHVVFDRVVMPGSAFVELALRAGGEVGCEVLEELSVGAPLVFDEGVARQLQVVVGEPDGAGRREVLIHSRVQGVGNAFDADAEGGEWMRHASGFLGRAQPGVGPSEFSELAQWPPSGAERVEVEFLYDRLAEVGLSYGPVFQGLRAAWRRGDELFTEIDLGADQEGDAGRFGIHPALLSASMHASLLAFSGEAELPVAWNDVRLYEVGASSLRVRLLAGEEGVSVSAVDQDGMPVLAVGGVVSRPVDRRQLQGAVGAYHDALFKLDWVSTPGSALTGAAGSNGAGPYGAPSGRYVVLLGKEDGDLSRAVRASGVQVHSDLDGLVGALGAGGEVPDVSEAGVSAGGEVPDVVVFDAASVATGVVGDVVETAYASAAQALALLHVWLADERLVDSRLVFVTRSAVAASGVEDLDLAWSPVWGLLRSAQSEHPGRFVLVDVDGEDASWGALPALLVVTDEPQIAVRSGVALVPRLARIKVESRDGAGRGTQDDAADGVVDVVPAGAGVAGGVLDPGGTVLVTGAMGTLGGLVARHLVQRHGVRYLLLVSRRGRDAEGAEELEAELTGLGSQVTIAACDVSDRGEVQRLVAGVPDDHPLTAVIHAAGVLDDGLVESLTAERLAAVMAPKVNAAWYLHELTEDLDLAAFVLFSAGAATFGNPGQGNYAAANVFLDALASQRRAHGLPASSLAWGLWEDTSEMTGAMTEADRTRLSQLGTPLSSEQGLALFDTARGLDEALLIPTNINLEAMRTLAKIGMLPPVLRSLVRTPAKRSRGRAGSLARRLAGVPEHERDAVILELVRSHVAAVLGHASPEAIDPSRTLLEAGFTSLTGLELKNSLSEATAIRLSPTLIIDNPTVTDVVAYLRTALERKLANEQGGIGVDGAASTTHDEPSTFAAMLQHAQTQGTTAKAVALLIAASEFRPAFNAVDELDAPPRAVTISTGVTLPRLICVPSFVAGWVPHQFARFARAFDGHRSVSALSLPGFQRGELVPGCRDALIDVLAQSVLDAAEGDQFVLVGYSIGGVLAHAIAEKLEPNLSGVVLIDTYESLDGDSHELLSSVLEPVLGRIGQFVSVDDNSLTSIGVYARLFAEWQPQPITVPSLLLAASEPLGDTFKESRLRRWQMPDSVIEVTGDHFALIEECAAATAHAAEAWILDNIEDASG